MGDTIYEGIESSRTMDPETWTVEKIEEESDD